MKVISLKPWIGEKYKSGGIFKKRVMVIGESYYEKPNPVTGTIDDPLTENSTNKFISAQINNEWTMRFFTKVAATFLGRSPITSEDKFHFWHSVAHYIFIQASVGNAPRIRPSAEMWEHAKAPFLDIITKNPRPECIVVFGRDLWNHLPAGDPGPSIVGLKTVRYPIGNGTSTLACGINHPASRGFSWKTWHPLILQAIELA